MTDPKAPLPEPTGLGLQGVLARVLELRDRAATGAGSGFLPVHLAAGSGTALLAASLAARGVPLAVVTADAKAAMRMEGDLRALVPRLSVRLLPSSEVTPYEPIRPDQRLQLTRSSTLCELARGECPLLVTSAHGWVKKAPPRALLAGAGIRIEQERAVDLSALVAQLSKLSYRRASVVEDPGDFAVRGDLLDVWPAGRGEPVRIELEFDRVKRIRTFGAGSQRSTADADVPWIVIDPTREGVPALFSPLRARGLLQELCDLARYPSAKARTLIEDVLSGAPGLHGDAYLPAHCELVPLASYLATGTVLLFEDGPAVVRATLDYRQQIEGAHAAAQGPRFEPVAHFLDEAELDHTLVGRVVIATQPGQVQGGDGRGFAALATGGDAAVVLGARSQHDLSQRLEAARKGQGLTQGLGLLWRTLEEEAAAGRRAVLALRTHAQADRVADLCEHHGLRPLRQAIDLPQLAEDAAAPSVHVVALPLSVGFALEDSGLFVLTEEEIFGKRVAVRKATKAVDLARLTDELRALELGDHVVHAEHGIGRYLGLVHRVVDGTTVDLITIEYAGGDKLLLPVYRLSQVQRYAGAEASPRLDRLGGSTFSKTKTQVRKEVRKLSDQLLRLYAERKSVRRPAITTPGDDYLAFEATFPHEETADQLAAIEDVLGDLAKDTAMDRLICGDVGFGKTEVALRACYLSVLAGRQVALLCPTTVLAEQHYATFSARLDGLGATVRVVSRFQSKKAVEQTLADLKQGKVDVVIGTHRLLSKDVHFKALGLLVIDEEHRFGVVHKERIKELRRAIDVLTLSATPIPRTLSLSISGLRDISIIGTPPVDRRAVRTLTSLFDQQVIEAAISREVARGGQVFYVVPKVEGIEQRAAFLRALLPGLKVTVAHGQQSEVQLEKAMHAFVRGDVHVLLSTTIVESGLDIPRANTLLVERADLFGLAQLHQLRGRVGRSSERAYCYLLLPSDGRVTDEAERRLEALQRYSELGAGFHLATLDLEQRGAGEVLGAEQSGLLPRVGYELFARMLEEVSAELSGQDYVPDIDPEVAVDAEALLPESYVEDVGVRLSLYKRFASARSEAEVLGLGEELEDRFGPPPEEVRRFIVVMRLKTLLSRLRALSCNATKNLVTLHLSHDTPLSPGRLAPFLAQQKGQHSLTPDGRITRRVAKGEAFPSGIEHAQRLLDELEHFVETPDRSPGLAP
jgi:transcription-repair coupling factor (superfamily II helicase)